MLRQKEGQITQCPNENGQRKTLARSGAQLVPMIIDCLLKNISTKHSKYVVNKTFQHFVNISFREPFGRTRKSTKRQIERISPTVFHKKTKMANVDTNTWFLEETHVIM
jgi:transposase